MSPAIVLLLIQVIDLIAAGIEWYAQDRAVYQKLRDDIRNFIREGREPTEDEFASLLAQSELLTQRVREAFETKKAAEAATRGEIS